VNHQVDNGATAVYLACQEGHLGIVQHLVDEAGASMKLRCYDGMSCLHAATLSGQQSLLHWLVRPLPLLYMLLLHTAYCSLSVLVYAACALTLRVVLVINTQMNLLLVGTI